MTHACKQNEEARPEGRDEKRKWSDEREGNDTRLGEEMDEEGGTKVKCNIVFSIDLNIHGSYLIKMSAFSLGFISLFYTACLNRPAF